jgi:hypothetical protein
MAAAFGDGHRNTERRNGGRSQTGTSEVAGGLNSFQGIRLDTQHSFERRKELEMTITKENVEEFFYRYAMSFKDGLEGSLDMEALRSLYSSHFIAAGPQGVMTGDNDHAFGEKVSKGYEQYRQIGTKAMTVTAVEVHPIDETHCLAHVGWNSEFEKDGRRIDVPFTNAYLLEQNHGKLKVFGWITGDEVQVLKDKGLM